MGKRPSFTNINDDVCMYCSQIVTYASPGMMNIEHGCGRVKDDKGRYKNTGHFESREDDLTPFQKGCDKFESSGMPAYPLILKELIRRNPLAKSIPSDKNATETSWYLKEKLKKYLPKESFLKHRNQITD